MIDLLLNTIALDPHRWTAEKIPFFSLDALLPHVAEAGFDRLEVWQYHVSTADSDAVRRYRELADDLGVRFVALGLYPELHLTGAARRAEFDRWARLLDHAGLLGIELVKLFVGNRASADLDEAAFERSVDALTVFIARARRVGLSVTGETHAGTLFDSVDACRRVLARFPDGRLDVCFQPYDFADTMRSIDDYLALRDRVSHLHFQGRRGDTLSLLETADLDYDALLQVFTIPPVPATWCIEFVRDCVVPDPPAFDLDLVLQNARRDRDFLRSKVEGRVSGV